MLLDLYSCYLLPAYTLLFAGSSDWFNTNFSVLAVNSPDRYGGFLVWSILTAAYFCVLFMRMMGKLSLAGRITVLTLLFLALGSLAIGVPLPYLPERFPHLSAVHIVLCFSTGVFLMAALLVVILGLCQRERVRYRKMLRRWWQIAVGCGVLFWMAGMVSSAMEVYFVLSVVLLCRRLYQLQKEEE